MKRLGAGLSRLLGFAACLVPSILLTWAMTRGILRVLDLPAPFLQMMGYSALGCCVFAFFFTNIKTLLAGLILALASAVYVFFTQGYESLTALLTVPGPEITVVIVGLTALVTVAFSRRRVMLPPLIILACGTFLILTIVGFAPGLPEAAATLIALVAYTARSALHRRSGVTSTVSEGHLGLWVLPVAAVLAVSAWTLVASVPQLPKSEYLSQKLEYLNQYVMDFLGTSQPRTSFSLVSTGMQPDPQQLGGPVKPREDEALTVTTNRTDILLRGAVYSDYNGHTWYNADTVARYRMSDPAAEEVFNRTLPADGTLSSNDVQVTVTHLADGPSSLFTPFRVNEISPSEMMTLLLYFNDRGEVFSTQDIEAGISYQMEALLPTQDLSAISDWMATHRDIADHGYDTAVSGYLSLPESLPASVGDLARQLTVNTSNDAEAVKALAEYLSANTTYSLNPLVPPADKDFVAHFLDTKTGYCTYYASAMTVMARTLGIPARYAEGYQLPERAVSGEPVTVTQAESHAWCEIYFRGIGWIPVDVSAQDDSTGSQQKPALPEEEEEPIVPEPTPTPTPAPSAHPENTPKPTPQTQTAPKHDFPWRLVVYVLLVLTAIAAALFVPPMIRRHLEKRACRTLLGAVHCQYRAILRLLAFVGLMPKAGETLAQFADRVDRLMPMRRSMTEAAQVMMDLTYGPHSEPTQQQAEILTGYRTRLDHAIRLGKGWWFYTLHETLRIKK